eukprot:TRINITY_DN77367_c0_g1_i1.p3 TRINITY_DN77367_c0_g1~~TRINITY_DN77367_c0_g1_i1.p3  ORF type:complete len:204 (+),score=29.12 TRINITY_DN77367_c0_g1_i1:65-613(+)
MAYIQQDTTSTLQQAVKDLSVAMNLDPDNLEIKQKYLKYKNELNDQIQRDKKAYGGMFQKEELYDQQGLSKTSKNQSDLNKGEKCKEQEMEEVKRIAKKLGVDLTQPQMMDKLKYLVQNRSKTQIKKRGIMQLIRVFLEDVISVKKILMIFIFLYFTFRMYKTMGAIVGLLRSEAKNGFDFK